MKTGTVLSGMLHGGFVVVAIFGLPFITPEPKEILTVADVEILSVDDYNRQVSKAPEDPFTDATSIEAPDIGDAFGEVPVAPDIAPVDAGTDFVEAPSAQDKEADLSAIIDALAQPEVTVAVGGLDDSPETTLQSAGLDAPSAPALPRSGAPQLGGSDRPAPPSANAPPVIDTRPPPPKRPEPPEEAVEEDQPEETEVAAAEPEPAPEEVVEDAEGLALGQLRPNVRPRDFAEQVAAADAARQAAEDARLAAEEAERQRAEEERLAAEEAERQRAEEERLAAEEAERQRAEEERAVAEAEADAERRAEQARADAEAAEIAAALAAAAAARPADGPPMTAQDAAGLLLALEDCWAIPARAEGEPDLKIFVRVEFNRDGIPTSLATLVEPLNSSNPLVGTLLRSVQSAIARCHGGQGYDLPQDKYEQWQVLEIGFSPQGALEQW